MRDAQIDRLAPNIGAAPAALSARGAPDPLSSALLIGGTPLRPTHPAPNAPMIGTARGISYAEHFADRLVDWIRAEGLALEWQVDDLIMLAGHVFAPAADLELPIVRNLQGALKRRSDVNVQQDRRVYDRCGKLIGKTSFYSIAADGVSSVDQPAGEDAPVTARLPRAA